VSKVLFGTLAKLTELVCFQGFAIFCLSFTPVLNHSILSKVKKNLRFFNIFLLMALIVIGSVHQVHASLANLGSQTSEETRLVEGISDAILSLIPSFTSALFFVELSISSNLIEHGSKYLLTIPQLLCSNRIALPPPFLS